MHRNSKIFYYYCCCLWQCRDLKSGTCTGQASTLPLSSSWLQELGLYTVGAHTVFLEHASVVSRRMLFSARQAPSPEKMAES